MKPHSFHSLWSGQAVITTRCHHRRIYQYAYVWLQGSSIRHCDPCVIFGVLQQPTSQNGSGRWWRKLLICWITSPFCDLRRRYCSHMGGGIPRPPTLPIKAAPRQSVCCLCWAIMSLSERTEDTSFIVLCLRRPRGYHHTLSLYLGSALTDLRQFSVLHWLNV